MAHNLLTHQLTRTDLFRGLSSRQISEIARNSERVMFSPGDDISVCGESGDEAILVIEGELECTKGVGAGQPLVGDQAGLMIGEMAMFIDDFEHPSTFTASSKTKALMIRREAMLAQMADDPEMAELLVAKVTQRLGDLIEQLRQIETDLGEIDEADSTAGQGAFIGEPNSSIVPAAPIIH